MPTPQRLPSTILLSLLLPWLTGLPGQDQDSPAADAVSADRHAELPQAHVADEPSLDPLVELPGGLPSDVPADLPVDPLQGVVVLQGGKRTSRALVVVLHGGSWSERDHEVLARRALAPLDDEARRLGLRVLAPTAPASLDTTPWLAPRGEAAVLALVEAELREGRADGRRVHLAGHGAGATGALHLAARHPDVFAGVALWSGTPSPLWNAEGELAGLVDDPVSSLRGVPVYLWTGTDDRILDRRCLARFTDAMAERAEQDDAWSLRWEQGPGGHGYGARGARPGLEFLKRLRKRRRP